MRMREQSQLALNSDRSDGRPLYSFLGCDLSWAFGRLR